MFDIMKVVLTLKVNKITLADDTSTVQTSNYQQMFNLTC